ncbi:hypothetical protein IJI31_02880 [bacterium]|nr:hypothetical protein [bacterium]
MKKLLILVLIGVFISSAFGIKAQAAKKGGKSKVSTEEIQKMSDTVDNLTKKVYGRALLSPQDNENLIGIKIKLDNQMLATPDAVMAPLYYKAGMLYKIRDMQSEAIDCFQTVLENFGDTALAPKARAALKDMGVDVKDPEVKLTEAAVEEE